MKKPLRKKIIFNFLFISGFFLCANSFAQNLQDDREICKNQRGNWRQFGNGCVDSCRAKFDSFAICTQALTYGCDCGGDKCWNEKRCVDKKDYEKLFNKIQQKQQEELEIIRKERREKMAKDPAYLNYLHNLYPKPQPVDGKKGGKAPPAQKLIAPPANRQITQTPQAVQGVINPAPKPVQVKIPPGYLQQKQKPAINSNGQKQDLVFPVVPL